MWADEEVKLKYRWALVGIGPLTPRRQPHPPLPKQAQKKLVRDNQIYNVLAKPGSRAYVGYNNGTDAKPNLKELHTCSYNMVVVI